MEDRNFEGKRFGFSGSEAQLVFLGWRTSTLPCTEPSIWPRCPYGFLLNKQKQNLMPSALHMCRNTLLQLPRSGLLFPHTRSVCEVQWEAEFFTLQDNNNKLVAALREANANVEQWKKQLAAYQEETESLRLRVSAAGCQVWRLWLLAGFLHAGCGPLACMQLVEALISNIFAPTTIPWKMLPPQPIPMRQFAWNLRGKQPKCAGTLSARHETLNCHLFNLRQSAPSWCL